MRQWPPPFVMVKAFQVNYNLRKKRKIEFQPQLLLKTLSEHLTNPLSNHKHWAGLLLLPLKATTITLHLETLIQTWDQRCNRGWPPTAMRLGTPNSPIRGSPTSENSGNIGDPWTFKRVIFFISFIPYQCPYLLIYTILSFTPIFSTCFALIVVSHVYTTTAFEY